MEEEGKRAPGRMLENKNEDDHLCNHTEGRFYSSDRQRDENKKIILNSRKNKKLHKKCSYSTLYGSSVNIM